MVIQERYLRTLFVVGLLAKAFDGTVEIAAGILLFFPGVLDHLLKALIANELIEDPHDLVANAILHALPHLFVYATVFAALYVLAHGVIKVFLVVALLRDQLWAYPTAIVVFLLFIAYQVYAYVRHPSIAMVVFTVLDLFVIALTWHEYSYMRRSRDLRNAGR
ncbi:MAG: DUF2127 domain-containing protein [Alphaproteobacteria bacterium]|nr:DUF2127 domain-containing protein [Alphaproteobacteria bacterium]